MRQLDKGRGGQLQAKSDRAIMKDVKRAALDMGEIWICGEPLDQMHLLNAWVWGLARLPEPARTAITEALVRDLERWRNEVPQLSGDELLAELREAIAPPQPAKDESGGTPRLRGRDTIGRPADVEDVFKPGKGGPGRRTDRKKMRAEAHG